MRQTGGHDTARIRRADAAHRAETKRRVSQYPLHAGVRRDPPRRAASWLLGFFFLLMAGVSAVFLPAEVNSAAYLIGVERLDTFNPVSYGRACGKYGCHPVTHGFLSGSGADVTWGGQVPLGRPFQVSEPVWAWGMGRDLIGGAGGAIVVLVVGLSLNAFAIWMLVALLRRVRHTLARRRQGAILVGGGEDATARSGK